MSQYQPNHHVQPRHRKIALREIPDLVSSVLKSHHVQRARFAKSAVKADLFKIDDFNQRSRFQRDSCLQNRDWHISFKVRRRMRENDQRDLTHVDPSALALKLVPTIPLSPERGGRHRSNPRTRTRTGSILLRKVENVPRYDAWIPVIVNFWVGKDLNVEPYMPFLGDHDNECEAAFEVYEDMAGDAGKDLELSDGELNDAGKFVLPRNEVTRIKYFSMTDTLWREATRKAILAVLDRIGEPDENLWKILAQSLGIRSIPRVKAVANVAQQRRDEQKEQQLERQRRDHLEDEVKAMKHNPVHDQLPLDEEWSCSTNPLNQFCFTCHQFVCYQHAGVDVQPILPIEDLETTRREELIAQRKVPRCSNSCAFYGYDGSNLQTKTKAAPNPEKWSPEEMILLRDAVTVFGLDPCSLAVVIGNRTCNEVAAKLNDPIEADIALHEIRKARTPRRLATIKKEGDDKNTKDKSKKGNNKTVVELGDVVAMDQDFVPCNHIGPCTIESCTCVQKGIYCESTCGCKFGRYGAKGATGGIVWVPPSEDAVRKGRARECLNRHFGCSCEAGNCCETDCPCFDQYRACSADWCKCDVTILPGRTTMNKRRCRNWPVTVGRHKRTFIGKSDIHGFGLFAAERFEIGDLVGVYSGQLIDTRLADMIGRIYDATNRTYIFNVTESLVIDGGLLGSKAKFCNHTKAGPLENCHSRLVRVRGDAYVALFCKRPVNPGDEFLFDYRFTGEVPTWAKDEKGKAKK